NGRFCVPGRSFLDSPWARRGTSPRRTEPAAPTEPTEPAITLSDAPPCGLPDLRPAGRAAHVADRVGAVAHLAPSQCGYAARGLDARVDCAHAADRSAESLQRQHLRARAEHACLLRADDRAGTGRRAAVVARRLTRPRLQHRPD